MCIYYECTNWCYVWLQLIKKNEVYLSMNLSSKNLRRLFFFLPLDESAWRKPNPVFWNGFKLRRPHLILRLHKLFIVFLQLRSAAEETGRTNNTLFLCTITTSYEPGDELGHHLDHDPSIRTLQVLKRARPKLDRGLVRARSKGRNRGHRESAARKTIDGKNKVGFALHQFVIDGENRDRVSDEERLCMAHHHFRELKHDLTGYVFSLQRSRCALPEYQFHQLLRRTIVGVKAWGFHCVSHMNTEREKDQDQRREVVGA